MLKLEIIMDILVYNFVIAGIVYVVWNHTMVKIFSLEFVSFFNVFSLVCVITLLHIAAVQRKAR